MAAQGPTSGGQRRRVVVIAGPSGAGKSRLAARLSQEYAWPVVRLDDFYREVGEDDLPRLPGGLVDWDDPRSWRLDAAVNALSALALTGRTSAPRYDIAASRVCGVSTLSAGPRDWILAEGIFAAHVVGPLRERGLLAVAFCLRGSRLVTFARRLLRDLVEHRKPPMVLETRISPLRERAGHRPQSGRARCSPSQRVERGADRPGVAGRRRRWGRGEPPGHPRGSG